MKKSNVWRNAKAETPPMYEDIYFTDGTILFLGYYNGEYHSDCGKIIPATFWMWPDLEVLGRG